MLVVLDEKLKSRRAFIVYDLIHGVDNRLDGMVTAPNRSTHVACLSANGDSGYLILARALYRSDIEAEDVLSIEGTGDVHTGMAMLARHTSAMFVAFADLAHSFVLGCRDHAEAFRPLAAFGVAELDFRSPDSTQKMHPVVAIGLLQRLSRLRRPVEIVLPLDIFRLGFVQ